jgi:branched-chain amino acid transport system substrate-binding protein
MDLITFGAPAKKGRATPFGVALVAIALVVGACQPAASPTASPTEPGQTPAPTPVPATPPTDELGVVEVPPGEPLHIAFWGVLSGADVTLGEDSRRGIEVAIEDYGFEFMGHRILLTSEDALCTPEGGAAAAQKLAADPTIVALIGSTCSDETVGGIKTITDAGLTTISSSNTRPALTFPDRGPEYAGYLRTAHSDAFQGKAVAEFAFNELQVTTAATIHDGSAYAQALQQVFVDEYTALGGTVTKQEAVAKLQTDMRSVLTSIAADQPQLLYYPVFIAEGGHLTVQAKQTPGLENTVLMGSDGMFSPDFVRAAGAAAEGMFLSSPDFTAFQAGYAEFLEKYRRRFATVLSIFHAHAYDAANMLFAALEKVTVQGADGTLWVPKKALRDALFATKDFAGLTGTLTCSPSGDCGAPIIAVYQITAREVNDPTLWPPVAPIWPER